MRAVCTVLICFLAQGLFAQEGIEYWFGTDPGAGNGTFIAQGSGDGASLSTSGLPPGNHTAGIRARDAEGFWSFPRAALLRIEEETPEAQTIEYFWDEDPGIGNAASLPVDAHPFSADNRTRLRKPHPWPPHSRCARPLEPNGIHSH